MYTKIFPLKTKTIGRYTSQIWDSLNFTLCLKYEIFNEIILP